jgi:hypothetical protein
VRKSSTPTAHGTRTSAEARQRRAGWPAHARDRRRSSAG